MQCVNYLRTFLLALYTTKTTRVSLQHASLSVFFFVYTNKLYTPKNGALEGPIPPGLDPHIRRLLDNIGYSTTSVTQHHQLLNIINLVNKRN
jgi:hypothetical protein